MKPIPSTRQAPKLVSNPRAIARRYTFNALWIIAALQASWLVLGVAPPEWLQVVTLVIAVAGALGAFVDQPGAR